MATILMKDQVCNVVYVDADLGTGLFDGTTPANAVTDLPTPSAMVDNTVYLIRRDDTNAVLLRGTGNTTGNHIYIIGMPLSTDWLYPRMPAEATSAWDADGDVYAKVDFELTTSRAQFDNFQDWGMHRLQIVSPSGGGSNDVCGIEVRANSTRDGGYFFTNNKWVKDTFDLDNPAFVTNNTSSQGASLVLRGGDGTGDSQWGTALRMTDNHFEFNGLSNTYHRTNIATQMLQVQYFDYATINDNNFWCSNFHQDNSLAYFETYYVARLDAHRNHMKLVFQDNTSAYWRNLIYFQSCGSVDVSEISVTVDRYYNQPTNPTFARWDTGIGVTQADSANSPAREYKVRDLNVDMDLMWNCNSRGIYLRSQGRQNNTAYRQYRFESAVSDISAVCVDSGGIGGQTSSDRWMVDLGLHSAMVEVANITGHCYPQGGVFLASNNSNVGAPVFKNVNCKGRLIISRVPFAEVNYVESPRVENDVIQISHSAAYIANVVLDSGAWASQQWLRFGGSENCNVIIDSVNVGSYINWATGAAIDDSILINNVDGISGNWYGDNYYYKGETFNVFRTGGAAASIRLTSYRNSNTRRELNIAPRPWKGLEWTPPSTGQHSVTMHVAHKLYADPTLLPKRVRMLVEVPSPVTGGYERKTYHSEVEGTWEDDSASTWNNDSGLTQLKCVLPFEVEDISQPVQVRVMFDWWDSSNTGYLYMDPLLVFA